MIKDVKFLVMDVDGTLTDGMIYCSESGELFKAFNIKDGCGIKVLLPKLNITPIVVTARKSKVLEKRCKELGISEIHQNCFNKLEKVIDVIMNFLFHGSTVSVDWSNTFMNVGANKIKYWRRKIAAFPLIGAKFLNY